ncbi:hypothetical protein LPJ59_003043 [Coemansia sp. RSA 2399]|nr:hypothetical protein LPJ59_003043 [Coemansia sp. RSA 2399]
MHSKKTSVTFSQEHNSSGLASLGNSNESKQSSEPSLALPTISPCPTEKSSNAKAKRFASASLDISIAKSHIAHLVLPSPTENMASTPLFSTGLVSPTFTVSPTISLAVSPVFCPGESGVSSFAPYRMAVTEPRAPELQRISYMSIAKHQQTQSIGDFSCGQLSAAENKADLAAAGVPTGQLTPPTGNNSIELDVRPSNESASMRIKRTISTIVRRSTSILRKSDPAPPRLSGSTQRSSSGNTVLSQSPTSASASCFSIVLSRSKSNKGTNTPGYIPPSPPKPSYPESVLATALSSSCFSVMLSNGMVSPLVRGSMVHIKVVMDADTIIIVPMMRSEMFARARERILTKLFRGGIPLVESKRRKLVARGENGSGLVIENNPTWRKVMDATGRVHRLNAHSLVQSRVVAKLTLHLLDPHDVSALSENHQSQAESPNVLNEAICTSPVPC